MSSKVVSLCGYYGGKARIADWIIDRLYRDCDVYIEMFGGMARVLLNLPRIYEQEIICEYSIAIVHLLEILGDKDRSDELIYRILQTDYSEEEFERARKIVDFADKDALTYYNDLITREMKKLHVGKNKGHFKKWFGIGDDIETDDDKTDMIEKVSQQIIDEAKNVLKDMTGQERIDTLKYLEYLINMRGKVEEYKKQNDGYLERNEDLPSEFFRRKYSDMEIAVATYVVYTQSRNSMGEDWGKGKFRNQEAYRKHITSTIYNCVKRLEGVKVYAIDNKVFYKAKEINKGITGTTVSTDRMLYDWLKEPRVMMYMDPSYISPDHEDKLLEGIDWVQEPKLSDALRKKPKDLGRIYARSFDYVEQEVFLECIYDAECKIAVSNYDLKLYNKYLNRNTGWKKDTFQTYTSIDVTNKKASKRLECLWMNY